MKSDKTIQRDVESELNWDPLLKGCNFNVAVIDGVAFLSGTVNNYAKKIAAEKAAKRVLGVASVVQNIAVDLPQNEKFEDFEIGEAARFALRWNSLVSEEKININVSNGWITIEGETEWDYQKNAILNIVENLVGVIGLTDLIKIKSNATPEEIKQKIRAAFLRSALIDCEKISIETSDSTIILTGKVRTWTEKKEAEMVAWHAPGITHVENKIQVDPELFEKR